MKIDIVRLPKHLSPDQLHDRAVVVFDVLRATTSIVTAIASGAKEVRVFDSLDAAQQAAAEFEGPKLLAGELECKRPERFDLGNSPGEYTSNRVAGKTIFLSTTNGTRAIVAAKSAARLFVAAAVNATATATMLARLGMDVTLLCAGTNGIEAPEDELGAGLVRNAIRAGRSSLESSEVLIPEVLALKFRQCPGGKNIIKAGLEPDIDFAARMDCFQVAVEVTGVPPIARKMKE